MKLNFDGFISLSLSYLINLAKDKKKKEKKN